MFFRGLDKNFLLRSNINAINLQWRRRYYEYGEFEIQIRAQEFDEDMCYIWNTQTNEVAIINKTEYKNEGNGDFVYLSGYFIESWLSYGVIDRADIISSSTPIISKCRTLVQNNIINGGVVLPVELGTTPSGVSGNTDALPDNEEETGVVCQSLLKSIECAQRLRFDYNSSKFYYDIVQGADKSDTGSGTVVFSEALGNVNEIDYSYDDSNYKNYAEIWINRGGDPERWIHTTYDWSSTEIKQKLYFSTSDSDSGSDDEARTKAKEEAKLELLNHRNEESVSFTPPNDRFSYPNDYTLGDRVQLVITTIEKSRSYRITGINETYKNNNREIELVFGDIKTTQYKRKW